MALSEHEQPLLDQDNFEGTLHRFRQAQHGERLPQRDRGGSVEPAR